MYCGRNSATRMMPARTRSATRGSAMGSGAEPRRGAGARFRRFDVAIAERGLRHDRIEQLPNGVRHLVHGTSERDLVGLRGARETAQLSDELQRGGADLIVCGRWREVMESLDAST